MFKSLKVLLTTCALFLAAHSYAIPHGKVDVGAAVMAIDFLESGKTLHTSYMRGVKADAFVVAYKGWFIKPSCIWGKGHDSRIWTASIGAGHAFPVYDCFALYPSVGITYTYLKTQEEIAYPDPSHIYVTEKFRSHSPYIVIDFTYKFLEKWTLLGTIQYSWSKTHTEILTPNNEELLSQSSNACGPNYSLAIEYSINDQFSVNLGAGYNTSLSNEKHGVRGKGALLGLAYFF